MAEDSTELQTACPVSLRVDGRCSRDVCYWECDDCGDVMQFEKLSKRFCCRCGWSKLDDLAFRCKDTVTHGHTFVKFTPEQAATIVNQLSTFGEKNVLMLGLTGILVMSIGAKYLNNYIPLKVSASQHKSIPWPSTTLTRLWKMRWLPPT